MFFGQRESQIVALVNKHGQRSVRDLAEYFDVTEVTIRRDLRKLEQANLLRRTHGGAVSIANGAFPNGQGLDWSAMFSAIDTDDEEAVADALIITPVPERVAYTLHERAVRKRIPIIAESAPQDGAIYVGHDNYRLGHELGVWTAEWFAGHFGGDAHAYILDITHVQLPNTTDRSRGFEDGVRSALPQRQVTLQQVDGAGRYDEAYRVALEALRARPETNIIFGINDDSILAGLQAYSDLGYDPDRLAAVEIGGEGKTVFDVLMSQGPLKACIALFPEIVGQLLVDAIVRLWNGEPIPEQVITPHRLVTPATLPAYYRHMGRTWEFNPACFSELVDPFWQRPLTANEPRTLSFVILYRTHEWYQNVGQAVRQRSQQLGVRARLTDWKDDLRDEVRALQRLIGKLAASYVEDGDSIILDAGVTTESMCTFLGELNQLSVVTNSANVFQRLQAMNTVDLLMTGGRFDRQKRAFVGRGAHLFLNDIRVDRAFIVAGGLSLAFGISAASEAEADVQRAMIQSARELVVLVDHTLFDLDADYHVVGLEQVDTVITDAGVTTAQREELARRGIRVLVAGEMLNSG